jgi:hypothetical protein
MCKVPINDHSYCYWWYKGGGTYCQVKGKFITNQRYGKRTLEGEVEERRNAWLPPYKVEVTKNGKIDGACDRKNEWDNALWGLVISCLNMAIVKVGDQNPIDMSELHRQLDDLFKYLNHELSACNFKDCTRWFMKSKQVQLKKHYKTNGQVWWHIGLDRRPRKKQIN